jgi:hypothetical protein
MPVGYRKAMPPEQVVEGRAPLSHPQQLSFDELAALRASDEANADSVIAEILARRTA